MPYHNKYLGQYRYCLLLIIILLFLYPLLICTNNPALAEASYEKAKKFYDKSYDDDAKKEIQSTLIELGYMQMEEDNAKFNNIYNAIIQFQNQHSTEYDLRPDGQVGNKTKEAMIKELDKKKKDEKKKSEEKKNQEEEAQKENENRQKEKPGSDTTSTSKVVILGEDNDKTTERKHGRNEGKYSLIFYISISAGILFVIYITYIYIKKYIKHFLKNIMQKIKENIVGFIEEPITLSYEKIKNEIIEKLEKNSLKISELEEKIIKVEDNIKKYDKKISETIEVGLIPFWHEINAKLEEISKFIKSESDIRNIIRTQAQKYFQEDCYNEDCYNEDYYNEESLASLCQFQDIIKNFIDIAEKIKGILNNQKATIIPFSGLETTLKAIPNYLKQFEKEELLGFIVSNLTKCPCQEGKSEDFKEFLFKEYPINKSIIKKLFNDKEFLKSNYEKLYNDLIFTVFGPFFCKMAKIQKENNQKENKMDFQQLEDLKRDISKFIEEHFKLKPMQIILGDKYDMNKHEIAGFAEGMTADQELYKKKSIVDIYRWGYESKDENKIIKAKVAIK